MSSTVIFKSYKLLYSYLLTYGIFIIEFTIGIKASSPKKNKNKKSGLYLTGKFSHNLAVFRQSSSQVRFVVLFTSMVNCSIYNFMIGFGHILVEFDVSPGAENWEKYS
jgi:hypothetical protein